MRKKSCVDNIWKINVLTTLVLIFILGTLSFGVKEMFGPMSLTNNTVSLDITNLPYYALRTSMRFIIAILASVSFSLIYGVLAAKNPRIRKVLIPLLDVFQSVPVLGYLSFTISFFIAIAPGNIFGIEMAIVFALFSSQAWNIAFSIYQSFVTIPVEISEVAKIYKLNKWQIFWRLELPFAIPGLIWNVILSVSSGWFFIVASEAISVGDKIYNLPGLGVYIAIALKQMDYYALCASLVTILCVIVIFNQLCFGPLTIWSQQFRYEFNTSSNNHSYYIYSLFKKSSITKILEGPTNYLIRLFLRIEIPTSIINYQKQMLYFLELLFWSMFLYSIFFIYKMLYQLCYNQICIDDIKHVMELGAITAFRIFIMVMLASFVWVPFGISISTNDNLVHNVQPLIQLLTSIPANLYFPAFVMAISTLNLNPEIALGGMMIMGSQWYILYNIIAGGISIPRELIETAESFHLKGITKWKQMLLPAIFPFYITGMISASGAAWNASIVSEVISWGSKTISATGIGAYIVTNTNNGDLARVALGVIVMIFYVVTINKILWNPLYSYASKKFRLD